MGSVPGMPSRPPVCRSGLGGTCSFAHGENAWISWVICIGLRIKKYFLLK